jgi:hypothetical protein
MALKMLPRSMKMPCGKSTHNVLNKFQDFDLYFVYALRIVPK